MSDGTGGTDTATVLLTITRDTVKPVALAPAAAFKVGDTLGTTTTPVHISWCATDPGSGIARYGLAQSTDSGSYATIALPTPKATSITRSFTSGHRYQLRVRAVDGDGSIGGYATGPKMLATRAQETSTALKYAGTWKVASSSTASGGKVRYATAANASVTYTFSGRAVAIASPTSSSRGWFRAYLDGVLIATVSERTSSAHSRRDRVRAHAQRPAVTRSSWWSRATAVSIWMRS